ncbi:pentapeptide repeat-containing protein [Phormidium tenue FACHB-886]|nr:pentapeptide repeat-containing protein [Phormidium tenue FACHB-886]
MRYQALVLLTPFILGAPAIAQSSDDDLRELYNLCSRFPYNSKCEGYDIPIPLAYRTGDEVRCTVALYEGDQKQRGHCKLAIADDSLTLYVEEGEPIELLENQYASREIKISTNQILALTYLLWDEVSGNLFDLGNSFSIINKDFATLEVTYSTEPTEDSQASAGNQTNIVKFVMNVDEATALRDRLMQGMAADGQLGIAAETPTTSTPAVQQLLDTNACVRCDLRGANLENTDLDGANLEGANLEGANLREAELDKAYLVGASLNGADLTDADLENAKLLYATLIDANLTSASLAGANLQFADLQNANLTEAKLTAPAVLQDANLQNANLTSAQLGGADFERANLAGANLEGADLSDLKLEINISGIGISAEEVFAGILLGTDSQKNFKFNTNLSNANLSGANLQRADLEDVILLNTNFSNAQLTDADLNDIDLAEVNLCGATMPDGTQSTQGCP